MKMNTKTKAIQFIASRIYFLDGALGGYRGFPRFDPDEPFFPQDAHDAAIVSEEWMEALWERFVGEESQNGHSPRSYRAEYDRWDTVMNRFYRWAVDQDKEFFVMVAVAISVQMKICETEREKFFQHILGDRSGDLSEMMV